MGPRSLSTRGRRVAARGVVAAAITSMLVTGCQSAVQQADQKAQGAAACQPGGTLVAVSAQPPVPGRVLAQGAANFFWVRGVFEPLMTTAGGSPENPQPVLATKWTIAPDDRSVVLELRQGVTFHSGRPFTAKDVVFTIKQALDPASPSDVKSILSGWQVEATGDHEVTIRSQYPLSPVLGSTLDLTPIVDSETYSGVQDGSKLIGTGPYKVESYQPGAQIVLVRNENYWQKDQAVLDRIENVTISDSTAQLSALRSGRAQLAFGMTTQDAQSLTGDGNHFQIMNTVTSVYPLVLDTTTGVFTNQAVRQAIGYAIDRQRINEQVMGGLGTTTGLYWSDKDAGYPANLANPYGYDPARAKQLIAAAGATGADVPITIINNPVLQAEYEIIANNLTDIGLHPRVIALTAPDYQQRLATGTAGNYLSFRGLNGTPAFMVETNADLRLQGASRTFASPDYQRLVNGVVTAAAGGPSAAAISDLTKYVNDQAFMQVMVTAPGIAVRDGSVQHAQFGLGGISWNSVCLAAK